MSQLLAMLGVTARGASKTYADDVFANYTYTGNGSSVGVTNNIDFNKICLLWIKSRSAIGTNKLVDTIRGVTKALSSESTAAQTTDGNGVIGYSTTGFNVYTDTNYNNSGTTYTSWTFRKANKFFDIVTYTGDGTAGRQIPHGLTTRPGLVIIKRIDAVEDWAVSVNGSSAGYYTGLSLNRNDVAWTGAGGGAGKHSATQIDLAYVNPAGGATQMNTNGGSYVAYVFGHDLGADGLIQCGFFTTDSAGSASISLGWEPQWILAKRIDSTSSWVIQDCNRGMPVDGAGNFLNPDSTQAEASASNMVMPNATGFKVGSGLGGAGAQTWLYVAIRRPNKPPTSGTQVYKPVTYTGSDTDNRIISGAGFAPDVSILTNRNGGNNTHVFDRMRGATKVLFTNTIDAEATNGSGILTQDGIVVSRTASVLNGTTGSYVAHLLKRAFGFLDEACYTGTGAALDVPHGLGVAPELWIIKSRDTANRWWFVGSSYMAAGYAMGLHQANAAMNLGLWPSLPTSTLLKLAASNDANISGSTYVSYLFATKAGVSKVGTYAGNGSSQTINCGFAAGARFVLIKRTDGTGDWFVWDTVRGIVAGSDPHLSLNSTSAEVTADDSIDPDPSGFIVNQLAATSINATGASYLYLAIA